MRDGPLLPPSSALLHCVSKRLLLRVNLSSFLYYSNPNLSWTNSSYCEVDLKSIKKRTDFLEICLVLGQIWSVKFVPEESGTLFCSLFHFITPLLALSAFNLYGNTLCFQIILLFILWYSHSTPLIPLIPSLSPFTPVPMCTLPPHLWPQEHHYLRFLPANRWIHMVPVKRSLWGVFRRCVLYHLYFFYCPFHCLWCILLASIVKELVWDMNNSGLVCNYSSKKGMLAGYWFGSQRVSLCNIKQNTKIW